MKHEYRYYRPDGGQTAEDAYRLQLDCNWDEDPEYIAQEAAEDYHSNHDGWEISWPLDLVVILTDGSEVRCEIELEPRPHFHARRLPQQAPESQP